jgi:hypothetical protein
MKMDAKRDPALQSLLDKQAITELVQTYCRACDRRDVDAVRALYHPDSIDSHGSYFEGSGMSYVDALPSMWAPMETLQHHVTMINIRIDGDYAESEAYGLHFQQMRTDNEMEDIIVGSRFLDKLERRDGVWKFSHRTHALDWTILAKPSQLFVKGSMFAQSPRGKKDETDPSYTFLRLFKRGT